MYRRVDRKCVACGSMFKPRSSNDLFCSDLERFQSNTAQQGNCIVWIGQLDKDGYGRFYVTVDGEQQTYQAHRWIFQHMFGAAPVVMHDCDTPGCVALHHLKGGTQTQNVDDAIAKGRHRSVSRSTPLWRFRLQQGV